MKIFISLSAVAIILPLFGKASAALVPNNVRAAQKGGQKKGGGDPQTSLSELILL